MALSLGKLRFLTAGMQWVVLVLVSVLVLCPTAAARADASRSNRERALDCTVQVIVQTRFGTTRRCTGMLYNSSGYVVTAFHAVADAESIQVFHAKHGVFQVDRILRADQRTNTALLGLRDWPNPLMPVARLADDTGIPIGGQLYVLHHPTTSSDVIYSTKLASRGVARLYPDAPFAGDYAAEVVLLDVTGPFDAGSAGGLVCNADYDVVGLIIGGGPLGPDGQRHAYAISATYLGGYLTNSYDVGYKHLQTAAVNDASVFDKYFGPTPPRLRFEDVMTEGYLVWFSRIHHASYADTEFTGEINDKIDKNWFYTADLQIDGKPATEISASRFYVCPAFVNPWEFKDAADCYVHFDADSLFAKKIYTNRDAEERIMSRYLIAMPLEPGKHSLVYENQGANYKSTGIVRKRVDLESGRVQVLDVTGLSVVNMQQLPVAPPSIGGAPAVRYEIERRPVLERELNNMIRWARIALKL
jgi:hypothetical protein